MFFFFEENRVRVHGRADVTVAQTHSRENRFDGEYKKRLTAAPAGSYALRRPRKKHASLVLKIFPTPCARYGGTNEYTYIFRKRRG